MDTTYAEATNRLNDEVTSACSRAERVLSNKEIAAELQRIAQEIENDG